MVMTDPYRGYAYARIRNANAALHETVNIPASRMKQQFLKLYKKVSGKERWKEENTLKVTLKYGSNNEKVIAELNVFPNQVAVYAKKEELPRTSFMVWVSQCHYLPSKGVMKPQISSKKVLVAKHRIYVWQ